MTSLRTPHTPHTPHPETDTGHPEDVFRRGLQLLLDKDMDGWLALWRADAVLEFPFAAEGAPRRLTGREQVAAYMRDYPELLDVRAFPDVTVHRTEAPETIVVEMRAEGFVAATGEPYEMTYINVVTVRAGRIVHYRDYWSPAHAPVSLTVPELSGTDEPSGTGELSGTGERPKTGQLPATGELSGTEAGR